MKICKYSFWIFLLLSISIFHSCRRNNSKKTDLKKKSSIERRDSLQIFQTVLDSFFIEGVQNQDVLIIKNDLAKSEYILSVQGNPVKYIVKPEGYPKGENFDYSKLIISFEKMKVSGLTCSLTIYCKRAGVIGDFVLVQVDHQWIIQSFNIIYT